MLRYSTSDRVSVVTGSRSRIAPQGSLRNANHSRLCHHTQHSPPCFSLSGLPFDVCCCRFFLFSLNGALLKYSHPRNFSHFVMLLQQPLLYFIGNFCNRPKKK
ncbi:hypothetical protein XENOCAPTIV_003439 [Xenoophorus captivus]|uniref:Uncharacterized protein n=1 Tax=Xenoophorus captivus TaxID=1517983 RepID=A0ABV0QL43_9TELE